MILVRNVRLRGKHKLADKWEPAIHVVVSQSGTLPVYTVQPEFGKGPVRTLHRDLLLPCGFLPATPVETEVRKRPSKPKTHEDFKKRCSVEVDKQESLSESEECDLDVFFYISHNFTVESPRFDSFSKS